MKIGIITHYNVHNHGALLQLYALKSVLEKENNDVSALTFKKNFDFMESGIDKKGYSGVFDIIYVICGQLAMYFIPSCFLKKLSNKYLRESIN